MIDLSVILALIVSAYLFVSVVLDANRKPNYSHARHTISELAEYGSEYSLQVSLGVFLPVAICLGVIAWHMRLTAPSIATLAFSISVGYGLGALFPCDPGSPMTGSIRQAIHNIGGGVQYVGGALSLMWIGESHWPGFFAAGLLVGLSAILLSFESRIRGIVQRIAEASLYLGLLAALLLLDVEISHSGYSYGE